MSYSVNTCVAPFCHSQNHSSSVPVTLLCEVAEGAVESSLMQLQPLVSRKASAACQRGVRGLHQHHLSASPKPSFHQFSFRRSDSSVGGLSGHRCLAEELHAEIFHRDQFMLFDNSFRPYTGVVLSLSLGFPVQRGGLPFRPQIAFRLRSLPSPA